MIKDLLVPACKAVTLVFGEASMLALGMALFTIMRRRVYSLRLATALLIVSSTTGLLKALTRIPRPPANEWLVDAYGYSFPSGHAAGSTVLALFLVDVYGAYLLPLSLLLAACVSLSRIVLGVHWPSDIVGGAIVGVIAYLLANRYGDDGRILKLLLASTIYSSIASLLAFHLDPRNPLPAILLSTSLGVLAGVLTARKWGFESGLLQPLPLEWSLVPLALALPAWVVVAESVLDSRLNIETLAASFLAGLIIVLGRALPFKDGRVWRLGLRCRLCRRGWDGSRRLLC